MKHLGDITKIKGCTAPVVDCIIGGSPCQDLSLAGKRAGLAGARSGLYMEQIRIIKEMRYADVQRGNTDVDVRPRYMVWENVPGAFSTNGGKDFAAVLEEAIRVAEPEAPDVPVPEKGWPTSGCLMGDKWSVAWRVLDAQFWGVPQRRRRIALVADFGGQSAPEILFVRKGVSGNLNESRQERKATARDAQNRSGADDRSGACIDVEMEVAVRKYEVDSKLLCELLREHKASSNLSKKEIAERLKRPLTLVEHWFRTDNGFAIPDPDVWYDLKKLLGIETTEFDQCITEFEFKASNYDMRNRIYTGDPSPTLTCGCGDNLHLLPSAYSIENHPADSRVDIDESGKVQTLTSRMGTGGGNVPMVMETTIAYCLQGGGATSQNSKGDGVNEDVTFTLNAVDRHAVAYGIGNGQVNQSLIEEKTGALNCMHDQQAVLQPVSTYQDKIGALCARDYKGVGSQYVDEDKLIVETNGVRVRYIVRRLTPIECERLQGFPDGWTDIGEWVDSKGKKHKEAASPRYKALGNSIAIPPWKWVLKRLVACYERDATMASLFDGIGGFPYIWEQLNGKGSCLWASEIEEFPMAVTKLRFGGKL